MNVVERSALTRSRFYNRVCFFTSTVSLSVVDPGFWGCASVVIAVVLNFLGHGDLLFTIVRSKGRENVAACWFRITSDLAVLILRPGFVDRATSPTAAFADIKGNFISIFARIVSRASKQRIASVTCAGFVGDMVPDLIPQLGNSTFMSSLCASAGLDGLLHDIL
jgi:hypothetical protein